MNIAILVPRFFFQLHEGVKKSGIMGFCDPCPGEPKKLLVRYTYNGENYQVKPLACSSTHQLSDIYAGNILICLHDYK